ncbi:type IV pilus modification PilV family protein [Chitinimonas lacunae]|uniref:Prepilin-type N-terminal cleavage/methylation domain-containing protein n=1 Tax=Chitinimonas lacunae TaxID=1963018 RepID=A0ABV8MXV0_9NEIS
MRRSAQGFTLMEVLVALVIMGIGLTAILVAYSGSMRLMQESQVNHAAAVLARSKLDEYLTDPTMEVVDRENEERYNGILYGYRMTIEEVDLIDAALAKRVELPLVLDRVLVQVFWGEGEQAREYRLVAYRTRPQKNTPPGTGNPQQPSPPSTPPKP